MSTKLTSIQFLPIGLHSYTILKEYIEDVIIANPKIIVYDVSAEAVSDLKGDTTRPAVEVLSDTLYTEGNGYIEIETKPELAIEAILTISSVEHNFPQFIAIKDDDTYVVGLEFTKGHIKTGTIDNPIKYMYTKNHLVKNNWSTLWIWVLS